MARLYTVVMSAKSVTARKTMVWCDAENRQVQLSMQQLDELLTAMAQAQVDRGAPVHERVGDQLAGHQHDLTAHVLRDLPDLELLVDDPDPVVRVNATIAAEDRAGAAAAAERARREGFSCVKLKVGVGDDAGRVDRADEVRRCFEEAFAARAGTLIVVAHRLSTVVDSDRIVVLDGGRVVAVGAHHELLDTSPLYRELAAHQLLVS